jgi:release factor glutamine methyltransferase
MESALTIARALAQARAAGIERLDAQLLLGHLLGRDRAWLLAHDDSPLGPDVLPRWAEQLRRRAAGEPLAYLVGEKEFHGLSLAVTPEVLIPRPDTEPLVDWALELLPPDRARTVVDLGTGSGAIALAIQAARPRALVTATDVSAGALAVATRNAASLQQPVTFLQGSWWTPLAGRRFDLIVSNPPYIRRDDPHLADLGHEPQQALTSGQDGLDAIRLIVSGASLHLAEAGWLLLEHGWDQAAAVAELLHAAGFRDVGHRQDLGGHLRCTGGRLPPSRGV